MPGGVRYTANFEKRFRVQVRGQRRRWFEDLYHGILRTTWPRFFLLVAAVYLGINVVFAFLYTLDPQGLANARPGNFEDAFYFSVHTLGTIGYGSIAPVTRYSEIVVVAESFVGIMNVALITGATFTKFARPTARVLFTERAVVQPRDGVPTLMFRMANWRHNQLVEAQLRVLLMVREQTAEGESFRRTIELPLWRNQTPLFTLTWTALHVIDDQSPFHGPGALDRLRARDAEMFLTLTGLDETTGATVHARHSYRLDETVWNARFADVVEVGPDGVRIIDYTRFHDVEPLPASSPAPASTR